MPTYLSSINAFVFVCTHAHHTVIFKVDDSFKSLLAYTRLGSLHSTWTKNTNIDFRFALCHVFPLIVFVCSLIFFLFSFLMFSYNINNNNIALRVCAADSSHSYTYLPTATTWTFEWCALLLAIAPHTHSIWGLLMLMAFEGMECVADRNIKSYGMGLRFMCFLLYVCFQLLLCSIFVCRTVRWYKSDNRIWVYHLWKSYALY